MLEPLGNARHLPDASWDSALLELGGHVLQSSAWLHVQRALGHETLWGQGDGWQWAGAVRSGRFPRYLYIPYGPASRTQTAVALRDAVYAAANTRLDFVRTEPTGDDAAAALRAARARSARPIQPRWTWILDIDADIEELRRGMEAGHRSRINAAARRGITIRSTADPASVEVFTALQATAAGRTGFAGQSAHYHRTVAGVMMPRGMASMYLAEAEGSPVAAAMCFDFGITRYYAHAASDPDRGRRLGAGPALLWQMILDARERGASMFDFWGVLPNGGQDHPWAGFSRFKKAFGGRLLERAGTWEIPVRPLRYRAYGLARRVGPAIMRT